MATSFDFYNPVLAATIETPDGDRFPLWTQQSTTALSSVGLRETAALSFLSDVTIEFQLAYLPIMKAVLTPPYQDARAFLDSRLVEWGQSTLEVICGYIGGDGNAVLSQPFRGVLLKPDVSLGENISITLNAQGVGGFGAIRQEANTQFNGASRFEIIEKLASRFKLKVDVSEVRKLRGTSTSAQFNAGSLLNIELRGAAEAAHMFDDKIVFAQGGKDYWSSIIQLVHEAGCHMHLSGNTLRILPSTYVFASSPVRVFSLFDFPEGKIGPVAGVFPITAASSPTSAVYLPGSSRGFLVQDISSDFREEIKKFVGDKQVNSPRSNANGASTINNDQTMPVADEKTGEGAEIFHGNPADAQLMAQVEAEYNSQTTLMGVQLTLQSLGDPLIMPGNTVAVRGLGQRLSGNYSVLKATHTINSSAYNMSLELVSNSNAALANAVKQFGPAAPEPAPDLPDQQDKITKQPGTI